MKKEKENLEKDHTQVDSKIRRIKENHCNVLQEMKNFTQSKNEPLIEQFEEVNEELDKKNKELEIILMVSQNPLRKSSNIYKKYFYSKVNDNADQNIDLKNLRIC